MNEVYREMAGALAVGKAFAVATVVRTRGSTERKAGAKMLIYEDGTFSGTIGGGCGEAEVWQEATEALRNGKPRLMKVDLTNDTAADEGMICGGIMEIFIEPLGREE